jgi:predicted secreted protein
MLPMVGFSDTASSLLLKKSYYEIELDNTSSVNVSGSNIDEVRLYPKGAQMVTLTYEPLVGVTSQSDARGYISYYEYDDAGRLSKRKQ